MPSTTLSIFEHYRKTTQLQESKVMNLSMRRELLSAGALATLGVLAPNALVQSQAKKNNAVF